MAAKGFLCARRLGTVTVLAALPALNYKVSAASDEEESKMVKISELPIYGNPEFPCKVLQEEIGTFRSGISQVRSAVWEWLDSVKETTDKIKDKYEIGKAHTQSTIDYIQNDPGVLPRIGVITVSGLGGIVLGYKGGMLRKTAYSSFAVLAATSLCYPKEAVAITTQGYEKISQPIKDALPESWRSKSSTDEKDS